MNTKKNHSPFVSLNSNVRGLPLSATLAINEHSARLIKQGKQIYKLGLGQSPFPVPQPVIEALKENAHQKAYQPVEGLAELREAVAHYHNRTQGVECDGGDVLIGPGSKELMFLVQLVYFGDLVIPTPSWVSYAPQAHILARQVHWLPTYFEHGWRLTPEEIESLCKKDPDRPRILILNYPNNPSGQSYSVEQLKTLAQVARKYKIVLLADEIYGELHHSGQHVSIARFYPEGTIISGGLSKWCGAGGWRLGTFLFPRSLNWLRDAMAAVASETYTATSAPIQFAAVCAFKGGIQIESYVSQSRRILRALGQYLTQRLKEVGVHVQEPEGAFYIFPDFTPFGENLNARGITTSEEFCQRLLVETGVAVLPGIVFGRPQEELTARIAYVDFDGARALEKAEQVPLHKDLDAYFLKTHCGTTLTAIDRVCEWLQRKK